ncbi:MAG: cystathionine beta-lyase [Halobacteriovoraceae bacterium]|nr:cystathionine beta-lyase [Halobacteriovoraceae bacterium]|tara:strand:- start:2260 stop:3453 length:1194 start_codon:yes stop_codon:yes gene_type:complete
MKKHLPDQAIREIQHFGEEGGVVPVIDVAATSTFLDPQDMERTFSGDLHGCYLYSRHSNPTVNFFGQKIAAMENAEAALGVASGMAAIACTIDQLTREGGHIISSRTVYGGTYALFHNILPSRGVKVSFVDINDPSAIEQAITSETKIIYTETLSNPLLNASDIPMLAALSKKHSLKLIVDNTFTPLLVKPLELGADIVVHSCTKFISGASDLIAGAIAGDQEFINSLIDVNNGAVMLTGPVMDPKIAHELYMRLDHLPIRMKAHSEVAQFLAEKMQSKNLKVIYPGLSSHPQSEYINKTFSGDFGHGGILTLECEDSEKARVLATKLQQEKFGLYAVSLGFARTLMSCSAKSTSSEIPEQERKEIGLSDGLLRMSIGFCGNKEAMWEKFEKVLSTL